MDFRVRIEQDEDGVWVAECPSLPGCISQGKTQQEALKNIKVAIRLHLKCLAEDGVPFLSSRKFIEKTVEVRL